MRDLKARRLGDPLPTVTDGVPGLIRAVEEVLPRSLRQRCLAHKLRNLEAKVPQERWREVKAGVLGRCGDRVRLTSRIPLALRTEARHA